MQKKCFTALAVCTLALLAACKEYAPNWQSAAGFAVSYEDYDESGLLAPVGAVAFWGPGGNVASLTTRAAKGEKVAFKAMPDEAFYELDEDYPAGERIVVEDADGVRLSTFTTAGFTVFEMGGRDVKVKVHVRKRAVPDHNIEYRAVVSAGDGAMRFDASVLFSDTAGGQEPEPPALSAGEGKTVMFRARPANRDFFSIRNVRAQDPLGRGVEVINLGGGTYAFRMPAFSQESPLIMIAEVDIVAGLFAVNVVEGGVTATFANNSNPDLSSFKLARAGDSVRVTTNTNAYVSVSEPIPGYSVPPNTTVQAAFTMPPRSVSLRFTAAKTYDVIVESHTRGSIAADRDWAAQGEAVTLTVMPSKGWYLVNYTLNSGAPVDSTEDDDGVSQYTFAMPGADARIAGDFSFVRTVFEWNAAENLIDGVKNKTRIPVGPIPVNSYDTTMAAPVYPVRNVYKDYAIVVAQWGATAEITPAGAIKLVPNLYNAYMSIGAVQGPETNRNRHVPGQFDFSEGTFSVAVDFELDMLPNKDGETAGSQVRGVLNGNLYGGPTADVLAPSIIVYQSGIGSGVYDKDALPNAGIRFSFSKAAGVLSRVGTSGGGDQAWMAERTRGPIEVVGGASNYTPENPGKINYAIDSLDSGFVNVCFVPAHTGTGSSMSITRILIERIN